MAQTCCGPQQGKESPGGKMSNDDGSSNGSPSFKRLREADEQVETAIDFTKVHVIVPSERRQASMDGDEKEKVSRETMS